MEQFALLSSTPPKKYLHPKETISLTLKMLYKLIALSVVFGLVVAEPIAKISSRSSDGIDVIDDAQEYGALVVQPELPSRILDIITEIIGYKSSALLIAVDVIDWLITNSVIITFGAIATLGFCKLTNKCSFVQDYVPIMHFRDLATPENLETAEEFLVSAVQKYAEKKKGREANKSISWL